MRIAEIETDLSEEELQRELEAACRDVAARDGLDGIAADDLAITPTANMGGLFEIFIVSLVKGAGGAAGAVVTKKTVEALWNKVVAVLESRNPGRINAVRDEAD